MAMFQQADHLPLICQYLVSIQPTVDNTTVRNAYHDLLIQEEDYEALRTSVDTYTSFDSLALAHQLTSHVLFEFRYLAAHLFKRHQIWHESVILSKQDRLDDAMDTVAESGDKQLAEELLWFLAELGNKEGFMTCLCVCYDLIQPDMVMELAWRHGMHDVAMPYIVQVTRGFMATIEMLEGKVQEIDVLKK